MEASMISVLLAENHNSRLVEDAIDTLKQFAKAGFDLYLYNDDDSCFKINEKTKFAYCKVLEEE